MDAIPLDISMEGMSQNASNNLTLSLTRLKARKLYVLQRQAFK